MDMEVNRTEKQPCVADARSQSASWQDYSKQTPTKFEEAYQTTRIDSENSDAVPKQARFSRGKTCVTRLSTFMQGRVQL